MAVKIKAAGNKSPAANTDAPNKLDTEGVEEAPKQKAKDKSIKDDGFIASLPLSEATEGGVTELHFRRINLIVFTKLLEAEKLTAQVATFVELCADPKLDRDDIQNLDSADMNAAAEIMQFAMSGFDDDDETGNDDEIWDEGDEAPEGEWDKSTFTYKLAYPISYETARNDRSEGKQSLEKIYFRRKATFKESAGFTNADGYAQRIQAFLGCYGRFDETLSVPLVMSMTDQLDIVDVTKIYRVVMPAILGAIDTGKKRRWKKL